MTIDEIFSSLATHMLRGIMLHEQLMNSYQFLGLPGYAKCHEYHYLAETDDYIALIKYKIRHFNKLVKCNKVEAPNIIPDTWYNVTRQDMDIPGRAYALEAALHMWIDWEEESKHLYEDSYLKFIELKEIDAAEFISDYIRDVDEEIVFAKEELLKKESMKFDIVSILEEQDEYKSKFTKKIRRLR